MCPAVSCLPAAHELIENPKLLDQLLKMLNSSKYETHYALSGSAN
jgi:hypothetical protein